MLRGRERAARAAKQPTSGPGMDWVHILGLTAGALTTGSLIPQVIKTFRLKSAGDISTLMFCILGLGVALWALYGLYIGSTPVIAANLANLALILIMLALKRRYRR